jgi:thioredoxin-dependent peroxiredoxin
VIETGAEAPDFTLPNQDGEPVTLSSLRGGPVVLYFYPKANTPGCTTQACGIRDHSADYEAAGATVLGVSPDPVKEVKKFHGGQSLNFTLLADEDHAVADLYGTWVEKQMYGRTYMGVQRATFIVDADGKVAHVIPKASPKTHDDEVLALLADYA